MSGGAGGFICDNCGQPAPAGAQKYMMKIEMFASADPPVITEEMLEGDAQDKMAQLIEEMKDIDPQELEDQVYECYIFSLCPKCRAEFHHGLIQQLGKKKFF